jgi:hypothetical protein
MYNSINVHAASEKEIVVFKKSKRKLAKFVEKKNTL